MRASIPGNTIEEIIDEGEQLILDEGEEATTKGIHGGNLVSVGRKASSHKGHKTGVSVLDARTEDKSRSKIMEWMLVTDEILVAHFGEREHIVTPFVAKLLIGCDFRG